MLPPVRTGAVERRRLDSWKEVASYLGRTVRTVQRWERDEGLPIHRHVHHRLGSVYAYSDELDRWWVQAHGLPAADDAEGASWSPAPPESPAPVSTDATLVTTAPTIESRPSRPWPEALVPAPHTGGGRSQRLAGLGVALVLLAGGFAVWTGQSRPATSADAARARQAAALYQQGRAFWHQRTSKGFDQARHAFEDALALDPDDARAHAGLADAYSLLEAFGLMAAADALPKARAAAERAVQLDPHLGEAHASLAFVLWEQHDLAGAMAEMERALELDPNYATAHHWYGLFLQQFLRRDEAIAELRRAVALDPAQPVFWTELASMLRFATRFEEAEMVLRDARERHPGFPEIYVLLSDLSAARHDMDQAVTWLRRAVALGDNRPRIVAKLGCLEATAGNTTSAREALHLLQEFQASGQHVPDDALAALLAETGDLDGAFRHIRRGLDERQDWVGGLLEPSSCFDAVRRDPRWPTVAAALDAASWLPLGSRGSRGDAVRSSPTPSPSPF